MVDMDHVQPICSTFFPKRLATGNGCIGQVKWCGHASPEMGIPLSLASRIS